MVIPLLVIFCVQAYLVLRMETIMADFAKLTAAVEELTVEVDAVLAALAAGGAEDPAVQKAVDDATAAIRVQSDKLLAAVPPPPSP
jgi:hypothetical protein